MKPAAGRFWKSQRKLEAYTDAHAEGIRAHMTAYGAGQGIIGDLIIRKCCSYHIVPSCCLHFIRIPACRRDPHRPTGCFYTLHIFLHRLDLFFLTGPDAAHLCLGVQFVTLYDQQRFEFQQRAHGLRGGGDPAALLQIGEVLHPDIYE